MRINQLSLFIENKPGTLNEVCQVLKENDINISTLSLADTEQFGIMRLLIHDWENAKEVLETSRFCRKCDGSSGSAGRGPPRRTGLFA